MSLLDIEENEVRTKPDLLNLMHMKFRWSRSIQAMKYCNHAPYIPGVNHRSATWSIMFWDRGTNFRGKRLRMNRVLYRVPKLKSDGSIIFEKKVVRNITEQNLKILIDGVNSAWDELTLKMRNNESVGRIK